MLCWCAPSSGKVNLPLYSSSVSYLHPPLKLLLRIILVLNHSIHSAWVGFDFFHMWYSFFVLFCFWFRPETGHYQHACSCWVPFHTLIFFSNTHIHYWAPLYTCMCGTRLSILQSNRIFETVATDARCTAAAVCRCVLYEDDRWYRRQLEEEEEEVKKTYRQVRQEI